jgi:hypothetical protein
MLTIRALIIAAVLITISAPVFAGDIPVKGYFKRDGTYVEPYHRTPPNNTINDNYSTSPNINPWTGKQGTRAPEPSWGVQPMQPIQPVQPFGVQPRQRW